MSNWHNTIEATAAAIDSAKRVGVTSPSGKRLVRRTERKLRTYFRKIESTFPMAQLLRRYALSLPPTIKESVEADFLLRRAGGVPFP